MSLRAARFLALMQASDDLDALAEKLEQLGVAEAAPLVRALRETVMDEATAVQAAAYSEMEECGTGDGAPMYH